MTRPALWRLAVAVLLVLAATQAAPAAPIAVVKFPFRVPTLEGGTLSDADVKGKIAVVDVWATWCGPCRMVIPHLVKLHSRFKDKGVTVIGLNADEDAASKGGHEAVARFVRDSGINYPIGLLNSETYVELARVMGFNREEGFTIPTTLVVGRNGNVLKRYPGYFPGQEREIEALISQLLTAEAAPPPPPPKSP